MLIYAALAGAPSIEPDVSRTITVSVGTAALPVTLIFVPIAERATRKLLLPSIVKSFPSIVVPALNTDLSVQIPPAFRV